MWKTEKDFGQMIMNKLKQEGAKCMRIESASTITGCPDLWVQGAGDDFFIELKNRNDLSLDKGDYRVPWRQGQQAWAQMYHACHTRRITDDAVSRKFSWTFMGCSDGMLAIRMSRYHEDSSINHHDFDLFMFSYEQIKDTNFIEFLKCYSYVPAITFNCYTREEQLYHLAEVLTLMYSPYTDVDIPSGSDLLGMELNDIQDLVYSLCKRSM